MFFFVKKFNIFNEKKYFFYEEVLKLICLIVQLGIPNLYDLDLVSVKFYPVKKF